MIGLLPPLPVAGPLAVAGLLLMLSKALPRPLPDVIALLTALGVVLVCIVLAGHAAPQPLVYWFGGWAPDAGRVLGIGFVIDQAGAAIAAFIGLLFAATLVFAWGYYDEVHAHFHVLMLVFMAGMIGFCLTHDLFNMFVWFEVMSVAAFAVTGYALRSSALEGALNFTVVNSIGSYLILGGIGLIYAEAGALDFSALAQGVARAPDSPVTAAAFALVMSGFLIKAAQVPFQFWLADAHAVAPSPVSVIFSGAMVALGVFGAARLSFAVFAPAAPVMRVLHTLLLGMGAASAVLGGVMALMQRHVKRLLAFSTISHVGVMVVGLALPDPAGLSGLFVYLVGHGLVKGALFMVAGILLARCSGIDEVGLRGRGRGIWPAGVAMAAGGLLLAGLPFGLMDEGTRLIGDAAQRVGNIWVVPAITAGAICTGAAVLRVTGRVFLGLGPVPGEEERSPTEREREKSDRPLWLMLLPTALLLLLALGGAEAAGAFAGQAAAAFMHPDTAALLGPGAAVPPSPPVAPAPDPPTTALPWLATGLALAIAAFELTRRRLPGRLVRGFDWVTRPPLDVLRTLHSGRVGDYVAWLAVGVALFALAFAFG